MTAVIIQVEPFSRAKRRLRFGAIGFVVGAVGAMLVPALPARGATHWVTNWAPSAMDDVPGDPYLTAAFPNGQPADQTVRMIVNVSAPGETIRLGFSNRFGPRPLSIGPVRVGFRSAGPAVTAGSSRGVRFAGHPSVAIGPGGEVMSDPVSISVRPGDELAVSAHVQGDHAPIVWHKVANWVTYLSRPRSGDATADETGTGFTSTALSFFWLDRLDVASTSPGAVVAFGDSITDGWEVAPDQRQTWPDLLTQRLEQAAADHRDLVINAGIFGNTIEGGRQFKVAGPPAVYRFKHDALDLSGVKDVIVFEGTNDLEAGATAHQVISGLSRLVGMARQRGVRIFGATITPRSDRHWDAFKEAAREAVNQWIRTGGAYDGVFDFDAVLRDSLQPHRLAAQYDSGDSLHPNLLGLRAIAESVNLRLLG